MGWLAWLNPLNLIKILSLIKNLIDFGRAAFQWVSAWLRKRAQEQEIKRVEKVEKEIEEANKIEDANERLKKKAELACELERSVDDSKRC